MTRFAGKTVLISGAAQGIGASIAQAFSQEGAAVALLDCKSDTPALANQLSQATGNPTLGKVIDLRDGTAILEAVTETELTLGAIDVLVSVAGILRLSPVLDITDQDWDESFAVNTRGAFRLCRAVARRMVDRRQGNIVVVSSNAATTPRTGMAAYAASKAALTQFTRCLGLELAPLGIRCNIVSPGSTDTAMQRQLWRQEDDKARVLRGDPDQFRLGIPLNRFASACEIADAVCFLASDQARHITLHDLRVDGGATLDR